MEDNHGQEALVYLLSHSEDFSYTSVVVAVSMTQEDTLQVTKHLPDTTRAGRVLAEHPCQLAPGALPSIEKNVPVFRNLDERRRHWTKRLADGWLTNKNCLTVAIQRRDSTTCTKRDDRDIIPWSLLATAQHISSTLLRQLERLEGGIGMNRRLRRLDLRVEEVVLLRAIFAMCWRTRTPDVKMEVGVQRHDVLRQIGNGWAKYVS